MYLLDSLLWHISRTYRRRKIRQSHVYEALRAPARPDSTALDRALERPAILSFARANELLVEKLTDEAMMHGSWPPAGQAMEYWCEHCPQYGHCSICGQDHIGGGAA